MLYKHGIGGKRGTKIKKMEEQGWNTKIHSVADALGNTLKTFLTPGNVHDMVPACKLISGITAKYILADKAYDADDLIKFIKASDSEVVIPPKSNHLEQRKYEMFICKIKYFQMVATRYEKLAVTFKAFVFIASCLVWLQ